MISRAEALKFLNEKINNKNIVKHMLATEALMRAMAKTTVTAWMKIFQPIAALKARPSRSRY